MVRFRGRDRVRIIFLVRNVVGQDQQKMLIQEHVFLGKIMPTVDMMDLISTSPASILFA